MIDGRGYDLREQGFGARPVGHPDADPRVDLRAVAWVRLVEQAEWPADGLRDLPDLVLGHPLRPVRRHAQSRLGGVLDRGRLLDPASDERRVTARVQRGPVAAELVVAVGNGPTELLGAVVGLVRRHGRPVLSVGACRGDAGDDGGRAPPAAHLDDEEHVQALQGQGAVEVEEVAGRRQVVLSWRTRAGKMRTRLRILLIVDALTRWPRPRGSPRIETEFRTVLHGFAQRLDELAALAAEIDVTTATDILWTLNHPDTWYLLVHRCGWTADRYEQWIGDALLTQLLNPRPP
jgi:hypothetical protein